MSQEVIEQTFSVSGRARLVVSNIRGSVVVRLGEPGAVTIQAVKHADSGSRIDFRLSQDDDGTVHAEVHPANGVLGFFSSSKPMKIDITANVPLETDLNVSVVSSGLVVNGLAGNIDLNGVSGDIELSDLTGALHVKTVSGDISGARLAGSLALEAVSGDVRLHESQLGSAVVRTVSGDVRLQTPLGDGPYNFDTVSGDFRLITLPDSKCTAELHTISGRIVASMPQTASRTRGTSQTLHIQGGGVRVFLKSVSGNLTVGSEAELAAQDAPVNTEATIPEPAAPPPLEPKLSNADILEKIERGEMSVEEGLRLIQGG